MIAILHTWGQTLTLHPHLHCIVPGGGLTLQSKWKQAKSTGKYLFSVKAMSKVFRARFITALKMELPRDMTYALVSELYRKNWVVYAKRPFKGPDSVVEYLGRYTHKIAISNHRIQNIAEGQVTFSYKDYRQSSAIKEITLDACEFIRRFSMHILPKGFVRIRHYGILSSTAKAKCAIQIKEQVPEPPKHASTRPQPQAYNPKQCPCCKQETMQTILQFNRRGPPPDWEFMAKKIMECLN